VTRRAATISRANPDEFSRFRPSPERHPWGRRNLQTPGPFAVDGRCISARRSRNGPADDGSSTTRRTVPTGTRRACWVRRHRPASSSGSQSSCPASQSAGTDRKGRGSALVSSFFQASEPICRSHSSSRVGQVRTCRRLRTAVHPTGAVGFPEQRPPRGTRAVDQRTLERAHRRGEVLCRRRGPRFGGGVPRLTPAGSRRSTPSGSKARSRDGAIDSEGSHQRASASSHSDTGSTPPGGTTAETQLHPGCRAGLTVSSATGDNDLSVGCHAFRGVTVAWGANVGRTKDFGKDEGRRLKDESDRSSFILHPSSFPECLQPFWKRACEHPKGAEH
jgi:hypothetical protein